MEKSLSGQDVGKAAKTNTSRMALTQRVFPLLSAWMIVLGSSIGGLLIAILWNPALADSAIGGPIADTVLGTTAKSAPIDNALVGIVFAVAAGLAASFTACNCVVFSCLAPLSAGRREPSMTIWRALLWMSGGIIAVTASYGIAGVILGDQLPILSQAVLPIGTGYPLRLLQSTTIFVSVGILLLFWGFTALQIVNNPLSYLAERRAWLVPLFLGILVGFFTVGRPFSLFRKLFDYATGTGNPALGALLLVLQGLSNIVIMALLLLLLTYGTGGRFQQWLHANPLRPRALTAIALVAGGAFFIVYWGIRLPARFGIGWFPQF